MRIYRKDLTLPQTNAPGRRKQKFIIDIFKEANMKPKGRAFFPIYHLLKK
jgi:hypothetical protein